MTSVFKLSSEDYIDNYKFSKFVYNNNSSTYPVGDEELANIVLDSISKGFTKYGIDLNSDDVKSHLLVALSERRNSPDENFRNIGCDIEILFVNFIDDLKMGKVILRDYSLAKAGHGKDIYFISDKGINISEVKSNISAISSAKINKRIADSIKSMFFTYSNNEDAFSSMLNKNDYEPNDNEEKYIKSYINGWIDGMKDEKFSYNTYIAEKFGKGEISISIMLGFKNVTKKIISSIDSFQIYSELMSQFGMTDSLTDLSDHKSLENSKDNHMKLSAIFDDSFKAEIDIYVIELSDNLGHDSYLDLLIKKVRTYGE